jgi:hypothetical protein
VGAFVGSLVGAILSGLLIYGIKNGSFGVPGLKATDIAVVLYSVPGALLGIAAVYFEGARREATPVEELRA